MPWVLIRKDSTVIRATTAAEMGWAEVREDVHATWVDRQEMLCWTIHLLMAAAGQGVKNKQPSVTVGACHELDALLG